MLRVGSRENWDGLGSRRGVGVGREMKIGVNPRGGWGSADSIMREGGEIMCKWRSSVSVKCEKQVLCSAQALCSGSQVVGLGKQIVPRGTICGEWGGAWRGVVEAFCSVGY